MKGDKKQETTTLNYDPTSLIRAETVLVECVVPDVNQGWLDRLVKATLPITTGGPMALELAEAMEGGIADE